LEHILETDQLAPEYYSKSLRIIRPKKYPIPSSIIVNGKKCLLLPADTNTSALLQEMNVFKPIPLVVILNYKQLKDKIYIEISFPATGHVYQINLVGDDASGYTIKKMTSYVT